VVVRLHRLILIEKYGGEILDRSRTARGNRAIEGADTMITMMVGHPDVETDDQGCIRLILTADTNQIMADDGEVTIEDEGTTGTIMTDEIIEIIEMIEEEAAAADIILIEMTDSEEEDDTIDMTDKTRDMTIVEIDTAEDDMTIAETVEGVVAAIGNCRTLLKRCLWHTLFL
jgi:hypothetical protein